jgi:hypothetical protein
MTNLKGGFKFPGDSLDRLPAQVKQEKQISHPIALVLSVLVPGCLTVCFLVAGMDKGQVRANLTLKVANLFEVQANITRVIK